MIHLRNGETFLIRNGYPTLCRDGVSRVFANRTQAEDAAERVGGTAFQGLSMRFLVKISDEAFHDFQEGKIITVPATFAKVKEALRALNLTITKREGEYRVNYVGADEGPAYYTNDLADAYGTGLAMAQSKKQEA